MYGVYYFGNGIFSGAGIGKGATGKKGKSGETTCHTKRKKKNSKKDSITAVGDCYKKGSKKVQRFLHFLPISL